MKRRRRSSTPVPRSGQTASRVLLDRFRHSDLERWAELARADELYEAGLYYHLLGLWRANRGAIRDALARVEPVDVSLDGWFRIVDWQYSLEPLSSDGSLLQGGRFNTGRDLDPTQFPTFRALYLAEDYATAYREKFGGLPAASRDSLSGANLALRTERSFTAVRLRGLATGLFDASLTASYAGLARVLRGFRISAELDRLARRIGRKPPLVATTAAQIRRQILLPEWRRMPAQYELPANSQTLARWLIDAGFSGVVYRSVRGCGRCIAVFPDSLAGTGTVIELADPAPGAVRRTRIDGDAPAGFPAR